MTWEEPLVKVAPFFLTKVKFSKVSYKKFCGYKISS